MKPDVAVLRSFHCDSCEYFGLDLQECEVIINPTTLEKKVFNYCDLCIDSKASIFSRATYPISNQEIVRLICYVGNQILNALNSYANKEAQNVN